MVGKATMSVMNLKAWQAVWLYPIAEKHHPRFEGMANQLIGVGLAFAVFSDIEKAY